jgi:hypothetical protein
MLVIVYNYLSMMFVVYLDYLVVDETTATLVFVSLLVVVDQISVATMTTMA